MMRNDHESRIRFIAETASRMLPVVYAQNPRASRDDLSASAINRAVSLADWLEKYFERGAYADRKKAHS